MWNFVGKIKFMIDDSATVNLNKVVMWAVMHSTYFDSSFEMDILMFNV